MKNLFLEISLFFFLMGGSTSKQKDLTDYRHLGDDELIERVQNCKRVYVKWTCHGI